MTRQLISLFLLFFLCTSFFRGSEEEKTLRSLHQAAEAAFHKKDYAKAKDAFNELVQRVGVRTAEKYRVEWPLYIDLVIRYAESCEGLGEYDDGIRALELLISMRPPKDFLLSIHLLNTRLACRQMPPQEAYVEMHKIAEAPYYGTWGPHDLSYYHALKHALNGYYDDLFQKAKRLLSSARFDKATLCYNEILVAIKKGYYPKASAPGSILERKVRYRLAEAYYNQANYELSLQLLSEEDSLTEQVDREMLYLAALCYKEKHDYERAVALFENYVGTEDKDVLAHYDQALFEIGSHHYQIKNYERARTCFEGLAKRGSPQPRTSLLARLYLARLALREEDVDTLDQHLDAVLTEITTTDPLLYECYYLKGSAAFAKGLYSKAKEYYQQSVPGGKKSGRWVHQALYHLALCYLKLGEQEKNLASVQKGEEILKALLNSPQKEASSLTLARLYLRMKETDRVISLLKKNLEDFSEQGAHEGLLLSAQAAPTYREREYYYQAATETKYALLPLYAEGWYLRGLNHFQEGLTLKSNEHHYFKLATAAFEQAYGFFETADQQKAAHILKLEAKASFYHNSPIASLNLLEKLIEQHTESALQREESLYLLGLIASQIPDGHYATTAENALKRVVLDYPQGQFTSKALKVLGTLYFRLENFRKAEETFLLLARNYAGTESAAEGWFWAAEAAEKRGDDPTPLREIIYSRYPDSPKAAEAYFRHFPIQEYMDGSEDALAHLNAFPDLFPNSPLLVVVHTLSSMHERNFTTAKTSLENALDAFSLCLKDGVPLEPAHAYFRCKALVDLALLTLNHAENPEEAILLLEQLSEEFDDPGHPCTEILTHASAYPPIYEEGEFLLATAYLRSDKKGKAQHIFTKMLSHYELAGIDKSPYLSHVWHEQGKMALGCGDHDTAMHCFGLAIDHGDQTLELEEKLSLWMDQSACLRKMKVYGQAMRLLSNIINADTSSPLRLEAMHKRAELYELQGRPELAIRQLEALAKKGSVEAQDKLRVNYGIE